MPSDQRAFEMLTIWLNCLIIERIRLDLFVFSECKKDLNEIATIVKQANSLFTENFQYVNCVNSKNPKVIIYCLQTSQSPLDFN